MSLSAASVSTKSHAMHSNVRMSKPGGPDTMPVNIICPSHFAQGGRSIAIRLGSSEMLACGMMMLPSVRWERGTLGHRYVDSNGDAYMNRRTLESLPNIDQVAK